LSSGFEGSARRLLDTVALSPAQSIRLLIASEKEAGHSPTYSQVRNRLDAIRRRLQPADSAAMLEYIKQCYIAGEISYFRAEGRTGPEQHVPSTVYTSHPSETTASVAGAAAGAEATVAAVAADSPRRQPPGAIAAGAAESLRHELPAPTGSPALPPSQFFRIFWTHAIDGDALPRLLDACVLDLTHKVNRYGWFVAIVSVRDATWTTRIVASAIVPREDHASVSFVLAEFARAMRLLYGRGACPQVVITDKGSSFPEALRVQWPATAHLLCRWHFSNSMLKELRPRVHQDWWPMVRDFMHWLLRDAHFATAEEFDEALLALLAITRPRSNAPNAATALSNWICNSVHLVRRKLFHRTVLEWNVMTAGMVASSIGEASNSALNSMLRVATLASRSLLSTARELVGVAARGKGRADDEVYMARSSVLVRPPRDLMELAATRLFTRETARRIRAPLSAARAAFAAHAVTVVSTSDDSIVWSVRRVHVSEGATAAPAGAHDEDGVGDADQAAGGAPSEHGSDEEGDGEASDSGMTAGNAALQDDDDPFAELYAARAVLERREGRDAQTDAFRERVAFAGAQLTLDNARALYRELRRELSLACEVRVALRSGGESDVSATAPRPLLRVSGASCTCGRPALCGFPCLHVWLVLPSLMEQHPESRRLADDRLFTADLVGYEEAQHVLRALCAGRWFHPGVSGAAVHLGAIERSAWPPSPPAPRSTPEGARASPAMTTTEALRQEVEDLLAASLVHLGERDHSQGDLTRVKSRAAEALAILTGNAATQVAPDAAAPADARPSPAPISNPAALRTGKKKRSPQKVDLSLSKRRRGSGEGRQPARRRL
jgi:hypothetical protein